METLFHVGVKITEETSKNFSKMITDVFDSGFKNHMDQETIRTAINQISETFKVESMTVKDSTFTGEDHSVNIEKGDK